MAQFVTVCIGQSGEVRQYRTEGRENRIMNGGDNHRFAQEKSPKG